MDINHAGKVSWSILSVVCAGLFLPAAAPAEEISGYHIGNSLTNHMVGVTYPPVGLIAQANGDTYNRGWHIKGGAGLTEILNYWRTGRVDLASPGPYADALPSGAWRVVVLEPWEAGADDEIASMRDMLGHLPATDRPKVYLYETWPSRVNADGSYNSSAPLDYLDAWNQPYTDPTAPVYYRANKAYFENILTQARAAFPQYDINPIPAGEVYAEVQRRIDAGIITQLSSAVDLYADWTHPGKLGDYLVGLTHYAAIFRHDPRGTIVPGYYSGVVTPALAALLQDAVWDVVSTRVDMTANPVPEPATATILLAGSALLYMRRRRA